MRFAYIFFHFSAEKEKERREISSCTFEVNAFAISADVSFLTANDFFILNFRYVYAEKKRERDEQEEMKSSKSWGLCGWSKKKFIVCDERGKKSYCYCKYFLPGNYFFRKHVLKNCGEVVWESFFGFKRNFEIVVEVISSRNWLGFRTRKFEA